MNFKKVCALTALCALAGCGGDDDDNSLVITPAPELSVMGRFIDSPVINLDYATETFSGVTSAIGEYEYMSGETVTFSIGDLIFPAVTAQGVITPLELAGTLDTASPVVLNIIRLLQTLDQDADPSNGITINDTAKANATQVDFELSLTDFAASDAVTNLIFNAGQDSVVSGLVDETVARTHFEKELDDLGRIFDSIAERDDRLINRYLTENSLTPELHESGMYYTISETGTGGSPTASSTVEVRYIGYLLNGTVFDRTSDAEIIDEVTGETTTETASFSLESVIEGWQIAIPLLKEEGKGIFYLPSALGYGETGANSIQGNTPLVFEVELVSISN